MDEKEEGCPDVVKMKGREIVRGRTALEVLGEIGEVVGVGVVGGRIGRRRRFPDGSFNRE